MDSRAELEAQVKRCAVGPAGVRWGPAQVSAVTDYLARECHGF